MAEEQQRPPQQQEKQPGVESEMVPQPVSEDPSYRGSGKLKGKTALITGGDSGIGKAAAILFAKEDADIAIVYLDEHEDAKETRDRIEEIGRKCLLISGDVADESFCREAVDKTVSEFGRLNILVNNAAVQYPQDRLEDITFDQLDKTFKTNIYSYFFMTKSTLPYMKEGAAIINTTSVTAFRGSPSLLDYASTKGAILAFTRSLALALVDRKIRVNAVAPGPVWTPLIPSSFDAEKVAEFGENAPMGRAGEPEEIAPSYVFLASDDSSYFTGQCLHPNGGEVVGS